MIFIFLYVFPSLRRLQLHFYNLQSLYDWLDVDDRLVCNKNNNNQKQKKKQKRAKNETNFTIMKIERFISEL